MKKMRHTKAILTLAALLVLGASPTLAAPAQCSVFRDAVTKSAADVKGEFVRPIVVSRGQGGQYATWDLVTNARIDGTLRCRGEAFVSFEGKITLPADATLTARFGALHEAALIAAFSWQKARVSTLVNNMNLEAADYLKGSAERGDVYVAGKVEAHEPGNVDLGLIWTNSDRTFIILGE